MGKRYPRRSELFRVNKDYEAEILPTNLEKGGEPEPASSPLAHEATSSIAYKKPGNLLALVKNVVNTGLARSQDPQPEGLATRGLKAIQSTNAILGSLPLLTLTCAFGLLVISLSYYVLPYGDTIFELFFFLGLLLIFVPGLLRLMSRVPSRSERIGILCVLGISLYIVQFMVSPYHVSSFDEFLHWRTADDIIRNTHLFIQNSMLPVSPYYPGLEIVTSFFSTVSGLSIFHTGVILISVLRLLMILSLYLFYEHLTGSSRMGSLATIIYMTNSHFLIFDALFSYETISLSMAIFMLYIVVRYQTKEKGYRWILSTAWIVLLALTITHHMTDYVFVGLFMLWAVVSLFVASPGYMRRNLAALGFLGLLLAVAYALFMPGNPAWSYLSSYFNSAFSEIGQIIKGASTARPLFVSSSGQGAPIWDRLLMLCSVAIVTFCLPFGLLCLWRQYRLNALAVVFGIVSLGYPMTQAFRFSKFGAEITDRSASFLFIPIAYVITVFITHFWPTRTLRWREALGIASLISIVFLGGITLEAGTIWSNLPGPYIVVADVRSIEPEGIQVASWAYSHLGPNNRVSTDRINRLLMSTYGYQKIITGSESNIDVSPVFFAPTVGSKEIEILRAAKVHYLVVDLRLSTSLPLDGFYFEEGEPGTFQLTKPISRDALTKFSKIPQIKQVFESGDIVIYDVSALVDGPST